MVSAKLTIPYISLDEKRDQSYSDDLKLASLYILADAHRRSDTLSATIFANYPFRLVKFDGDTLLIDLLGLNKTRIKYNYIPEIDSFKDVLEKACETPGTFLTTIKSKTSHFKEFSGEETINLEGLISNLNNPDNLKEILENSIDFESEDGPKLFEAILNVKDIEKLLNSLNSFVKKLKEDQKILETAKRSLADSLDIVEKVLKEETQNIKDSSNKVQARLKASLKKREIRLKKILDRDVARIRAQYKKQTAPLREDRAKRKRRLNRIERKMERFRAQGDTNAMKAERGTLLEVKKKFEDMEKAIKNLEKQKDGEIKQARDLYRSELKVDQDRIREEEERKKAQLKEKDDLLKSINGQVKVISGQIDGLKRKKGNKLRTISRFKMDFKTEDLELFIPFYIFQYGSKKFHYHPPVEIADSAGLFSRFRRMLADNPESKVNMLIKPRDMFTEKFLEKVVKSLGRDTQVGRMYRKELDKLNIFRDRQAVDLMMTGLVKMRRRGWINDSEYILLQEALVDQLGLITKS